MSSHPDTTPSAEDRQQLLADIEASLLQQSGIDAMDRDAMLKHFEDALNNPAGTPGEDGRVGPNRTSWLETMELLRNNQIIDATEQEDLIRQFDQATNTLQSGALQRTAEFARRSQEQGLEQARDWLAGQLGSDAAGAGKGSDVPAHVALSLRRRR